MISITAKPTEDGTLSFTINVNGDECPGYRVYEVLPFLQAIGVHSPGEAISTAIKNPNTMVEAV